MDPASLEDYKLFRDVLSFDTTYNTNKYKLIFATFCGVNHHKKIIIFANALLMNESKQFFAWLFNTFLEAVGTHPFSIVTDQDPSITAAIASCFPNTVHRFCGWHIVNSLA
jgi:hypothetical protein